MKLRDLRRKKKGSAEGDLIIADSASNNSLPSRKGFRRRIPPHVVVTSPLRRLQHHSSNRSRDMSALTTDEETAEAGTALVTPEKIPRSSLTQTSPYTSSSSVMTLEEQGVVDCIVDWCDSLGDLVTSPEMERFLHSSGHLVVKTAILPVTLPLHVANQTTRFVVGQCVIPVLGVSRLLLQNGEADESLRTGQPVREDEENNDRNEGCGQRKNPIVKIARGVWGFPGHVFGLASHVKDEVGGIILRTLAPALHGTIEESCRPGESTSETHRGGNVLERLRLDCSLDQEQTGQPAKTSQFLLRVDDLRVVDMEKGLAHYVDLNSLEEPTVSRALDRLVHLGISMLANHPTVRISNQAFVAEKEHEIEWKAECNTPKLLRRLAKMDVLGRLGVLRDETLIWSGRFKHDVQSGYDRQSRFYLARGVLNMSPRALLELLWDDRRTADYNKFCSGRTTLVGNDTEFLQGEDKVGTKVVLSETRVPLTSITVTMSCLMHARALDDGTGYIIVSRSCSTGPQGIHYDALENVARSRNEIHWGVNILRRVPNRPDLVDLTSLSQVGTTGVPQFLAAKIALMGVEAFFENARKLSG